MALQKYRKCRNRDGANAKGLSPAVKATGGFAILAACVFAFGGCDDSADNRGTSTTVEIGDVSLPVETDSWGYKLAMEDLGGARPTGVVSRQYQKLVEKVAKKCDASEDDTAAATRRARKQLKQASDIDVSLESILKVADAFPDDFPVADTGDKTASLFALVCKAQRATLDESMLAVESLVDEWEEQRAKEAEERAKREAELAAKPPKELEPGHSYKLSYAAKLMSEFEPASPGGSLFVLKTLRQGTEFSVITSRMKDGMPWYEVKTGYDKGWIDSASLQGHDPEHLGEAGSSLSKTELARAEVQNLQEIGFIKSIDLAKGEAIVDYEMWQGKTNEEREAIIISLGQYRKSQDGKSCKMTVRDANKKFLGLVGDKGAKVLLAKPRRS